MAVTRIDLQVRDDRGETTPFRLEWREKRESARWQRLWSDSGSAKIEVAPGPVSLLVRRGIHYDAVALELDLAAGQTLVQHVTLRQRFDPKALGWWGGESHMHLLHGPGDKPADFCDGARMGAGDGLDYLQLAWGWDREFSWPPAEELDRRARQAGNSHVAVNWNVEFPKAYMSVDDGGRSGNLHCFGHGWTVGLKDNSRGLDFFRGKPNFRVIQEVNRQGGIVGLAHPVRFWLLHNGNFVSNWASEAPFDFVAGVPYAAVDILNDSPLLFFESERFWYTLLNQGYKVSGTGNSDGALAHTRGVGIYRTYARIDGDFTWDKLARSIRDGKVVATSGPFVLFTVDGTDPGAEFVADGRPHKANVRAWSGPLPGETLLSVQLVRNGEVVRAWDLRHLKAREWEAEFELADEQFAWYCLRVLSNSCDPTSREIWGEHVCELAVANPVYFLPAGYKRPAPTPAQLSLQVTDDAGRPIAATVAIHNGADAIANHQLQQDGTARLAIPATASLVVSAPGFEAAERNLFLDCPELLDYCRGIATVWPSFFSPETYRDLRSRLQKLKLTVQLRKK